MAQALFGQAVQGYVHLQQQLWGKSQNYCLPVSGFEVT